MTSTVPHWLEVGVWWLLGVWAAAFVLVIVRGILWERSRNQYARRGIDAIERYLGKDDENRRTKC